MVDYLFCPHPVPDGNTFFCFDLLHPIPVVGVGVSLKEMLAAAAALGAVPTAAADADVIVGGAFFFVDFFFNEARSAAPCTLFFAGGFDASSFCNCERSVAVAFLTEALTSNSICAEVTNAIK